jgi:hypothetical protein
MKKRNLLGLSLAVFLILSFMAPRSWAGSTQKHRWEGVAIGAGVAMLGSALFHQYRNSHRDTTRTYRSAPRRTVVVRAPGYRVTRRTWVEGERERIWHEGYSDRRGRWHPGYWEERHYPGHWIENRVRVGGPCR